MSAPVKLTSEEKYLIVTLPLRVGIKVSTVDDEGDELGADVKELNVIKKTVERSEKIHRASILVGYVARKSKKINLGDLAVGDLCGDAKKVNDIIKKFYTEDDVTSYKKMLVEVGTSVARAYREEGLVWDDNEAGKFDEFTSKVSNFFGSIINRERHLDMNISPSEDEVITDVVLAMK